MLSELDLPFGPNGLYHVVVSLSSSPRLRRAAFVSVLKIRMSNEVYRHAVDAFTVSDSYLKAPGQSAIKKMRRSLKSSGCALLQVLIGPCM